MQTEGINMKQGTTFKKVILITILAFATASMGLTGCATEQSKDQGVEAILLKEKELIAAIKKQRTESEVINDIQKSESLKKAEAYLSLGLDEIQHSNEVITEQILRQDKMEVNFDRLKRNLK